jgi:hypothetical protein
MSMAQIARENAIPFEAKKDGLRQRQSGHWVLSLVIHPDDMDQRIAAAMMGTRYECALVEKNDDETPRNHAAETRDKWRALGPVKQAGIRCADPVFWAFLRESQHYTVSDEPSAAGAVRSYCNVPTRSDLDKPGFSDQRILWFDLDKKFQAWKAREYA